LINNSLFITLDGDGYTAMDADLPVLIKRWTPILSSAKSLPQPEMRPQHRSLILVSISGERQGNSQSISVLLPEF
jgi:hypothetical protein